MTDVTTHREAPLPKAVPMLLSFVAGYVDSYTYLALFGLFAAQASSSPAPNSSPTNTASRENSWPSSRLFSPPPSPQP